MLTVARNEAQDGCLFRVKLMRGILTVFQLITRAWLQHDSKEKEMELRGNIYRPREPSVKYHASYAIHSAINFA